MGAINNFFNKKPSFYLRTRLFGEHYKLKNLNRGVIGIGGAGSGKTHSLIKPLLAYCCKHMGCLTFDPKGELTPLINSIAEDNKKSIINFF